MKLNGGRKVITLFYFLGSDEERVKKLERVLQDYDIEATMLRVEQTL